MKNQLLVFAIAGIFLTGALMSQQAFAQTTVEDLEALVNLLIQAMADFNTAFNATVAAIQAIFAVLLNQTCPEGEFMIGIDDTGAAICAESGVFVDPVTGDTCIGSVAACNPPS